MRAQLDVWAAEFRAEEQKGDLQSIRIHRYQSAGRIAYGQPQSLFNKKRKKLHDIGIQSSWNMGRFHLWAAKLRVWEEEKIFYVMGMIIHLNMGRITCVGGHVHRDVGSIMPMSIFLVLPI